MSERAASFARVAGEYDRGRPGYPPEAVEWLLGDRPLDVVDLGAGTGKLTREVAEAGHRVVAVEPLAEMRDRLAAGLPGVAVIEAGAEDTGLPAASADAVVAGAAFHWFDTDRALPEIARILRPLGVLGLLGNHFDDEGGGWVRDLADILREGPSPGHRRWPDVPLFEQWFAEVEDRTFAHEQRVTPVTLLDLVQSYSRVAVLADSDRHALLERVRRFWDEHPQLRGRDAAMLAWRTEARRCRALRER